MRLKKFISTLTLTSALLVFGVTPVLAEVINQEPEITIINDVEYLDGIPVYENQDEATEEDITMEIMDASRSRASVIYNKWFKDNTSYYYTDQKTDSYSNYTSQPYQKKLTAKSIATVKITGSTSFGFKEVASADLSVEINYQWEESYEETINVKPYTKYSIKTACNVKKTQYQYNDKGITDKFTAYYAYTHDDAGGDTWIWENAL